MNFQKIDETRLIFYSKIRKLVKNRLEDCDVFIIGIKPPFIPFHT